MLGGYESFAGGEIRKEFKGLKNHTQVRVQATFHCIDLWNGEYGYLQIDNGIAGELEYAWTISNSPVGSVAPRNVCGSASYGESHFSNPIDITIPHTKPNLRMLYFCISEIFKIFQTGF